MKMLLNLKTTDLKNNDLIVFNAKTNMFENIHYELFIASLKKENQNLKNELKKMREDFDKLKNNINEKLKDYHDVLNMLKGD